MKLSLRELIPGNSYLAIVNTRGNPKFGGFIWYVNEFKVLQIEPHFDSGTTLIVWFSQSLNRNILNTRTYNISVFDDLATMKREVMRLRLQGIQVNLAPTILNYLLLDQTSHNLQP